MTYFDDETAIKKIIQIINNAWLDNNLYILNDYFDQEVVFMSPDYKNKLTGKNACINSYKQFLDSAEIIEYQQGEPEINIWDNTAAAFYEFDITYLMKGKTYSEKCKDFFVFNRDESDNSFWKAVYRMLTVLEKRTD